MNDALTLNLDGVESPELVFGLVGALGSPMDNVIELLKAVLATVSYSTHTIRLSDFLEAYILPTPHPSATDSACARWNALMSRGNELRQHLHRGDALAIHAAAAIGSLRPAAAEGSRALKNTALILRQLKHPEEVQLLRAIYGPAFHLIGLYTDESVRDEYLRNVKGLTADEANQVIQRDADEEFAFGQQVTHTYHLSDLFLPVHGWGDEDLARTKVHLARYIDLVFGRGITTPTVSEYGMYLAHAASLRSADLSRQVGAAILSQKGDVLALGANEVPCAGGGQYWPGAGDDRDYQRGHDSNEVMKLQCVRELLGVLTPDWADLTQEARQKIYEATVTRLEGTRVMNLTEFGRAVHAEMEAILSGARNGISVSGGVLYTTTFPCHNCAKHIVGAGITRVVYIEPYPKSLASWLHGDAIAFALADESGGSTSKVPFESFVGVAPRRATSLFSVIRADGSRIRRKVKGGAIRTDTVDLRTRIVPLSHVDCEAILARFLSQLVTKVPPQSTEPE